MIIILNTDRFLSPWVIHFQRQPLQQGYLQRGWFLSPWVIHFQRLAGAKNLLCCKKSFYPHGSFIFKDWTIPMKIIHEVVRFYPHGSFIFKDWLPSPLWWWLVFVFIPMGHSFSKTIVLVWIIGSDIRFLSPWVIHFQRLYWPHRGRDPKKSFYPHGSFIFKDGR